MSQHDGSKKGLKTYKGVTFTIRVMVRVRARVGVRVQPSLSSKGLAMSFDHDTSVDS